MNIGDHVSWTHVQNRGGGTITLRSWEGKIIAIDGQSVTIKRDKTGRIYQVHRNRVRPINADNELTEIVMHRGQHAE